MKNVEIGCRVKIGSSKAAKFWKVIGMILPLPYTTDEAGGQSIL